MDRKTVKATNGRKRERGKTNRKGISEEYYTRRREEGRQGMKTGLDKLEEEKRTFASQTTTKTLQNPEQTF